MTHTTAAVFGIAAEIVNTAGTVPYVIDIFRRKTKPERAMWWVYSALFMVLFLAQMDAGAGWLLWLTGGYVASSLLIAILSLKYGYGRFHRRDFISLLIAAVGLGVWWHFNQALLAIIIVIIVDFAGFWLTLIKTWHAPHTETLIAWELSLVASVLSIFAVSNWNLATLIYPMYAVLAVGLIVWLILYRRARVSTDVQDF